MASQAGNYTVSSTVNGCTSSPSTAYNYVTTGLVNLGNGDYIRTHPNPVQSRFVIEFRISGIQTLDITVMDARGKELLTFLNRSSGDPLNLSKLPPGMYIIKLSSRKGLLRTIKIIRQ